MPGYAGFAYLCGVKPLKIIAYEESIFFNTDCNNR